VAFSSFASNLAPGVTNSRPNVFLWDVTNGLTNLTASGTAGSGSPDGDHNRSTGALTGAFRT
jgi:hypothetical protein